MEHKKTGYINVYTLATVTTSPIRMENSQLNKIKKTSTDVLKQRLKDREKCWMKILKTLV